MCTHSKAWFFLRSYSMWPYGPIIWLYVLSGYAIGQKNGQKIIFSTHIVDGSVITLEATSNYWVLLMDSGTNKW